MQCATRNPYMVTTFNQDLTVGHLNIRHGLHRESAGKAGKRQEVKVLYVVKGSDQP